MKSESALTPRETELYEHLLTSRYELPIIAVLMKARRKTASNIAHNVYKKLKVIGRSELQAIEILRLRKLLKADSAGK